MTMQVKPFMLDKVCKRFGVRLWELMDLVSENNRNELIRVADDIDRYETKLKPYLQRGKDPMEGDFDHVDRLYQCICLGLEEASIYLRPVYHEREVQEEKRKAALAQKEAEEWGLEVNAELERLTDRLTETLDVNSFFAKESEAGFFFRSSADSDVRDFVDGYVGEWIDSFLSPFPNVRAAVTHEYTSHYFQVLSQARYVLQDKEPCLTFSSETQYVMVARLAIGDIPLEKQFYGYRYTLPMETCQLGYFFEWFPALDNNDWQTVPLRLLQGIVDGNTEVEGVEVLRRGKGETATVFKVRNFREDMTIPDAFAAWLSHLCEPKGLAAGLLADGLIDKNIARIIEKKLSILNDKTTTDGGSESDKAVVKLTELGWTEVDARKAVLTTTFSHNAGAGKIVQNILQKLS